MNMLLLLYKIFQINLSHKLTDLNIRIDFLQKGPKNGTFRKISLLIK
jgi:hypothetical protein